MVYFKHFERNGKNKTNGQIKIQFIDKRINGSLMVKPRKSQANLQNKQNNIRKNRQTKFEK